MGLSVLFSARGQIAAAVATSLLFASIVYGQSSIFSLLAPISLLLLMAFSAGGNSKDLLREMVTPFLPFVLVVGVAAFFQETLSEAFGLLSIGVIYVAARLMRAVLNPSWILFSVGLLGLALGIIRQLSLTPLAEVMPVIRKLAEIHERNPAGTALSFGAVAIVLLIARLQLGPLQRIGLIGVFVVSLILLLLSDVMSALVGGLVAIASVGLMILLELLREPAVRKTRSFRFWVLALLAVAASALTVWAVNAGLIRGDSRIITSLERDFSGLTGRTQIWECYGEALAARATEVWLDTLACTGHNHANLHSTYLQSHLIAGNLGLAAVIFAFGFSIFLAVRGFLRARSNVDRADFLLSLGFVTLGAVLGLVESYLLVYLYPTIVVFIAAPRWGIGDSTRRLAKTRP